jgi:hypothetical protein
MSNFGSLRVAELLAPTGLLLISVIYGPADSRDISLQKQFGGLHVDFESGWPSTARDIALPSRPNLR